MNSLEHQLQAALRLEGIEWVDLCRQSEQLVLFGSRACGSVEPTSDWDVLCVLQDRDLVLSLRRRRLGKVDLVEVGAQYLTSSEWLESELASHIARYGIWLQGADNWSANTRLGAAALHRKEQDIRRDLAALRSVWDRIGPSFQTRRARRLRLQLQRLRYLDKALPVPPAFVLNKEWPDYASEYAAKTILSRFGLDGDEVAERLMRAALAA